MNKIAGLSTLPPNAPCTILVLEYVELKRTALREQVAQLECKWEMSFEKFSRRCREECLEADPYSREVEQDFWAW